MKKLRTRRNYIDITIFFLLATLAIHKSIKYICNPWLWYDESGQFWISKGLNHFSDPLSPTQGLFSVIENNRYYNLDPGGFSVILHFWTKISNDYIFLRLLPYLFFLLFVYYVYKLIHTYTKSRLFSVIVAFSMFWWDIAISRMVEIRAYTMEMFGLVFSLYIFERWKELTKKELLLISLILSFFCTSRYEFIIIAFVFSQYVIFRLYKQKASLSNYLIFSVPLVLTVGVIYFYMMLYQNASVKPLHYLDYLGNNHALQNDSMFLLYILNCIFVVYVYLKNRTLSQVELFSVSISTLIVILSVLYMVPWDKIRSISISIMLFLNLSILFYKYVVISDMMKGLAIFIVILCIGNHTPYWLGTEYDQFIDFMRFKKEKTQFTKMFIDYTFNPSLRYLYEYGLLKNDYREEYPHKYILQKGGQHNIEGQHHHYETNWTLTKPDNVTCDYYFLISKINVCDRFTKIDNFKLIYRKVQ